MARGGGFGMLAWSVKLWYDSDSAVHCVAGNLTDVVVGVDVVRGVRSVHLVPCACTPVNHCIAVAII